MRSDADQSRYKRDIVAYLNHSQSLRIIPASEGWIVYAHSKFFQPSLMSGEAQGSNIELLDVFEEVSELSEVESEKGGEATNGTWTSDSVFGLIDSWGRGDGCSCKVVNNFFDGADILICDDMSREISDFIAADTSSKRVIFAHAKCDSRILSASAFHVVCSQVMKNLDYLTPYSLKEPPNLNLWDEDWSRDGIGNVGPRIRQGEGDAEEIWERIISILRDPSATREVWIVYGDGFSLDKMKEQCKKKSPKPQALQIYYLLQSTWSAVSTTGARFRVLCPKALEEEEQEVLAEQP